MLTYFILVFIYGDTK